MTKPGEWLQWRHDTQRTGQCEMPGKISNPKIVSKAFVGAYEDWFAIPASGGTKNFSLSADVHSGFDEEAVRRAYDMDLWLDVEGTGVPEKVEENIMVRYIPKKDGKGYQRVRFDFAFANDRWGNDEPTYGFLEERHNGEWKELWQTETDPMAFWRPNLLLTDIDNDGQDEIITTEKGRLIAYDYRNGKKIRDLKYHNSRNYGEYFAYDFTGNGYPDFVSIVHFPAHAEVILNDGKEFKCAWFDKIQQTIADTDKLLVTVINPISDVDGDGKVEIIFSRYNQRGDNIWHTTVVEPLTGEQKLTIPNFVAVEILNSGVNGKPQLYGYKTKGNYINSEGNAAIYEINGGTATEVWSDPKAFWYQYLPRKPFSACIPRTKIVTADGKTVFYGEKLDHEQYRITQCRFENGKMNQLGETIMPAPAFQYVSDSGEILLKTVRSGDYKVSISGFGMNLIGSRVIPGRAFETGICEKGRRTIAYGTSPSAKIGGAPVVFEENGKHYITLPDLLNRNVFCFSADKEGTLHTEWKLPGFGMEMSNGLVVRRDGDKRTLLMGKAAEDNTGLLVEVSPEGKQLRNIAIDYLPVVTLNPLTAYAGMAPASWFAAPFNTPDVDDILITNYMNNMHSGFSTAYNGKTLEFMWTNDKCGNNMGEIYGFGGMRPFAGYPNGDGTERLISQYPGFQYFADGKTGEVTRHYLAHLGTFYYKDNKGDVLKSGPALHSEPIVISKPKKINTNLHYIQYFDVVDHLVLFGGSSFTVALWLDIQDESGALWCTEYQYAYLNTPTQGVCDINGDGYLEVLGWEHAKGELVCRCLTSGDLRWTLDLPGGDFGRWYTTCDINNDGIDELLLSTGDKLYAITGKNGKGEILWELDVPAPCSGPVVADVDGDGFCEILLSCDDGNLYLVK